MVHSQSLQLHDVAIDDDERNSSAESEANTTYDKEYHRTTSSKNSSLNIVICKITNRVNAENVVISFAH